MQTMLEAVRWDGSDTGEIERFGGREPAVVDDVLEVVDPHDGERLRVPLGGWLVRADGRFHVLGASPQTARQDVPAERVEAVGDVLAFESGFD